MNFDKGEKGTIVNQTNLKTDDMKYKIENFVIWNTKYEIL